MEGEGGEVKIERKAMRARAGQGNWVEEEES